MDGSVIDAISGKHYDLETFENDLVKVESAGRSIRVGIKDENGTPFSWWEPAYPFTSPPADVSWPSQNGWNFTVETPSPELTHGVFEKEDERHVLTLRVTDTSANPKPVEVSWQ